MAKASGGAGRSVAWLQNARQKAIADVIGLRKTGMNMSDARLERARARVSTYTGQLEMRALLRRNLAIAQSVKQSGEKKNG